MLTSDNHCGICCTRIMLSSLPKTQTGRRKFVLRRPSILLPPTVYLYQDPKYKTRFLYHDHPEWVREWTVSPVQRMGKLLWNIPPTNKKIPLFLVIPLKLSILLYYIELYFYWCLYLWQIKSSKNERQTLILAKDYSHESRWNNHYFNYKFTLHKWTL